MLPLDIIKRQLIFAEDLEERLEARAGSVLPPLPHLGGSGHAGRRFAGGWVRAGSLSPEPHALGLGTSSLSEVPEGARGTVYVRGIPRDIYHIRNYQSEFHHITKLN